VNFQPQRIQSDTEKNKYMMMKKTTGEIKENKLKIFFETRIVLRKFEFCNGLNYDNAL
jgi:DUF4097 and DUF4098 domain-containing protein YvlB